MIWSIRKCPSSIPRSVWASRFGWVVVSVVLFGCDSTDRASSGGSASTQAAAEAAARASFAKRLRAEIPTQENPWVIAHALLAFGPELRLAETSALERLSSHWVEREGGRVFVPLEGAGVLGEQHPHLVLKTLVEVAAENVTAKPVIQELMKTAVAEFVEPETYQQKNDMAWFLEAVARLSLPADQPIRNGGPTPRELTRVALATLEEGDALVEAALRQSEFSRPSGRGEPETHGVYAYTCGGQHLLQSVLIAAEHGLLVGDDRERLARRLDVYLQRLEAEYQFRLREYLRAIENGETEIRAQQMFAMFSLKLIGHGLEILGRAHRAGIGDRTKIEAAVRSTRGKLLGILRRLDDDLDPERTLLESLRRSKPGMWQLWFGDGCHALRGLSETDAIGR